MSEAKHEDAVFEQKLQEQTKSLKNCQEQKQVVSCLKCDKIIGCDTRKSYVNAVYNSMSKGQGGGFEF